MVALVLSLAAMKAVMGAETMVAEEAEIETAVAKKVTAKKVTDQAAEISVGGGGKDGTGMRVVSLLHQTKAREQRTGLESRCLTLGRETDQRLPCVLNLSTVEGVDGAVGGIPITVTNREKLI